MTIKIITYSNTTTHSDGKIKKDFNGGVLIRVVPFDYKGTKIREILFRKDIVKEDYYQKGKYEHKMEGNIPNHVQMQSSYHEKKKSWLEIELGEENVEEVKNYGEYRLDNQLIIKGKGSTNQDNSGVSIKSWGGAEEFRFVLKKKGNPDYDQNVLLEIEGRKLAENVFSPKITSLKVGKDAAKGLVENQEYIIKMEPSSQWTDKWGGIKVVSDGTSCWLAGSGFNSVTIENAVQNQSNTEQPSTTSKTTTNEPLTVEAQIKEKINELLQRYHQSGVFYGRSAGDREVELMIEELLKYRNGTPEEQVVFKSLFDAQHVLDSLISHNQFSPSVRAKYQAGAKQVNNVSQPAKDSGTERTNYNNNAGADTQQTNNDNNKGTETIPKSRPRRDSGVDVSDLSANNKASTAVKSTPSNNIQQIRQNAIQEITDFLNKEPKISESELEARNHDWKSQINQSDEKRVASILSWVLTDILSKREDKLKTNELRGKISQAQTETDPTKLAKLFAEIEASDGEPEYDNKGAERADIEKHLAETDFTKYKNAIVSAVNNKLEKAEIKVTELSQKGKELFEKLKNSSVNSLEAIRGTKEELNKLIGQTGAEKKLNGLLNEAQRVLKNGLKGASQVKDQLISFITSSNLYSKAVYQAHAAEVDRVITNLEKNTTASQQPTTPVWKKAVLPVSLSLGAIAIGAVAIIILKKSKNKQRK